MSKIDIIRAWKDEEYRATLTPEQLAALPDNPAGMVELSDADLNNAAGGIWPTINSCATWCPMTIDIYCPSNVTICPITITIVVDTVS